MQLTAVQVSFRVLEHMDLSLLRSMQAAVSRLDGVLRVDPDSYRHRIAVVYNPQLTDSNRIHQAIRQAGFPSAVKTCGGCGHPAWS